MHSPTSLTKRKTVKQRRCPFTVCCDERGPVNIIDWSDSFDATGYEHVPKILFDDEDYYAEMLKHELDDVTKMQTSRYSNPIVPDPPEENIPKEDESEKKGVIKLYAVCIRNEITLYNVPFEEHPEDIDCETDSETKDKLLHLYEERAAGPYHLSFPLAITRFPPRICTGSGCIKYCFSYCIDEDDEEYEEEEIEMSEEEEEKAFRLMCKYTRGFVTTDDAQRMVDDAQKLWESRFNNDNGKIAVEEAHKFRLFYEQQIANQRAAAADCITKNQEYEEQRYREYNGDKLKSIIDNVVKDIIVEMTEKMEVEKLRVDEKELRCWNSEYICNMLPCEKCDIEDGLWISHGNGVMHFDMWDMWDSQIQTLQRDACLWLAVPLDDCNQYEMVFQKTLLRDDDLIDTLRDKTSKVYPVYLQKKETLSEFWNKWFEEQRQILEKRKKENEQKKHIPEAVMSPSENRITNMWLWYLIFASFVSLFGCCHARNQHVPRFYNH